MDSNKTNFKIDNLQLVTRSKNLKKRRFNRDPVNGKESKYVGTHKTEEGVYLRILDKADELGILDEYLQRKKVVR